MAENALKTVKPEIQFNKNLYPFISFCKPGADGKQVCTNLYLSKEAAREAEGVKVDETNIKEFLEKHTVTIYVTEDGEERQKLSRKGVSSWVSFEDLWG